MEFIKNVIVTICILSIIITVTGNLKINEKYKRQMNMIFSLVFSAGVLATAIKNGIDFEMPDLNEDTYYENYSEIEENAEKYMINEIQSRTDKIICDLLNKNSISYKTISTEINISEDGSILINNIYYKGDDFISAEKIIEENFSGTEVIRID